MHTIESKQKNLIEMKKCQKYYNSNNFRVRSPSGAVKILFVSIFGMISLCF